VSDFEARQKPTGWGISLGIFLIFCLSRQLLRSSKAFFSEFFEFPIAAAFAIFDDILEQEGAFLSEILTDTNLNYFHKSIYQRFLRLINFIFLFRKERSYSIKKNLPLLEKLLPKRSLNGPILPVEQACALPLLVKDEKLTAAEHEWTDSEPRKLLFLQRPRFV